jgi:hypothetical protein
MRERERERERKRKREREKKEGRKECIIIIMKIKELFVQPTTRINYRVDR